MRKTFVGLVFSSTLLAGCASTTQSVKADFSFQPNGNSGLVVVSTRLVDDCAPSLKPLDRIAAMTLDYHSGTETNGFFILRNPLISKDFENPGGYFYARELPAGHYVANDFSREGGKFYFTHVENPLQFDVKSGTVSYLGEVTVHVQTCKETDDTHRADLRVSDQRERDGKLFDSRMTSLSSKAFEYTQLHTQAAAQ